MIAGLTPLGLLSALGFHQQLQAATDTLIRRLADSAESAGIPLATNHVCGMFGVFFTDERTVDRYSMVLACRVDRFKRFFHGNLGEGLASAPLSYESDFQA